jgi:hypothetical protein
VDGEVEARVGAEADGRVRLGDLCDRRAVVQIFVAVPFPAGDPPGLAALGDVEFGELLDDPRRFQIGLFGEFHAEAEAVVEQADPQAHEALQRGFLAEGDAELVVAVRDVPAFAPGLFPAGVDAAAFGGDDLQVAFQLGGVCQDEAEAGLAEDDGAVAAEHPVGAPFPVQIDAELQSAGGRLDGFRGRGCGAGAGQQEDAGGEEQQVAHGISLRSRCRRTAEVSGGRRH